MVATISLFQGITRFASTWERLGGDVTRISELGCLACYRPDVFGEIIYAGECGGDASAVFDAIKALSDGWLKEGREKSED